VVERNHLQPRESLVAAGAAQEDRQLVLDQLAAAAGEDGRSIGQARTVLMAALGGESSDATVVWGHAGQDGSATIASGLGEPPPGPDFKRRAGRWEGKVSEESVERGAG